MELRMSSMVAAKGLFMVLTPLFLAYDSAQPLVMLFEHHSGQGEWTRWYRLADLSSSCFKDVN